MTRVEVKRLHSPDVDDLSTYVPEDPGNFGILVQVMAGPAGQPGEESFDIVVCTPAWLIGRMGPGEIKAGRHHVLVKQYDYARLADFVASFARECTGETWQDAARCMGRLGKWEFEDYR